MGMDLGSGRNGVRGDINVTPLIDVVLVLLIIFMVLTPAMLKHVRVAVPEKTKDSAPSPAEDVPIVVEYTAKGELTINTELVSAEQLASKLAERLRSDQRKVVFFKAEDDAAYGQVVRLMDIARGAGAKTLAIVTK
jgi:biopolymer transport protein TolR